METPLPRNLITTSSIILLITISIVPGTGHASFPGPSGPASSPLVPPLPLVGANSEDGISRAAMAAAPTPYLEPFKNNATVFAGQTAYLQCIVKHVGDKTVSWIRRRDLHILTSGNHVYTNDRRVFILRQGKLYNSWTLKIENVNKRDEGAYECQVNTEPKSTSSLYLIVYATDSEETDPKVKVSGWKTYDSSAAQRDSNSEPKYKLSTARILGSKMQRTEVGSAVNLTCEISHVALQAPNVSWFHNDLPIKPGQGGGSSFKIETIKGHLYTTSHLVIDNIRKEEAGKYSCGGTAVYPDSITLEALPRQMFHFKAGQQQQDQDVDRHQRDSHHQRHPQHSSNATRVHVPSANIAKFGPTAILLLFIRCFWQIDVRLSTS